MKNNAVEGVLIAALDLIKRAICYDLIQMTTLFVSIINKHVFNLYFIN